MHQRLIVVSRAEQQPPEWHEDDAELDKPKGMLINEWVFNSLQQENFCGQEGRWSTGPADWFVIGGRWSGELSQKELGTDFNGLCSQFKDKDIPEGKVNKSDWDLFESKKMISTSFIESLKTELNLFWQSDLGGETPHPWVRDTYANFGYPDDSMELTENLFKNLFKKNQYAGEEDFIDIDSWEGIQKWSDLESEIHKSTVWLTVIDYHC